jgi:hypothetical protein
MGPPTQIFEQQNSLAGLMPKSLGAAARQEENTVIKEAIDRLLSLAEPSFRVEDDGRLYSSKGLNEIQAPLIQPVAVQTLSGFVKLYQLQDEERPVFIHILGHDRVLAGAKEVDEWNRRPCYFTATLPSDAPKFRFGQYLDPEDFVIGMMTMFEDADFDHGDHRKVVKLCSGLVAEAVTISNDDGFSQQVITRQGMAMKNEEKVSPRVRLSPWRTFREVSQPASEFVLRLRGRKEQQPMCALFEADGGEWKNDAIRNIKDYFIKALPDADIVA